MNRPRQLEVLRIAGDARATFDFLLSLRWETDDIAAIMQRAWARGTDTRKGITLTVDSQTSDGPESASYIIGIKRR